MNPGPTYNEKKEVKFDITSTCLNKEYLESNVKNIRKVSEFECFNDKICDNKDRRYFLINSSKSVDNNYLFTTCFLTVNKDDSNDQKDECFYDIPLDSYNKFIRPIQSQIDLLSDDNDLCGYRALPYSYLDAVTRSKSFDSSYGVQFDISWDSNSFFSDRIQSNIHYLKKYKGFMGPEPYQKRYDD